MSTEPLHVEPVVNGATPATAPAPRRRRSTGAWIVAIVVIVGMGAWFAVRLQAALKTQAQLATERAEVAKAAEKAPVASSQAAKAIAPAAETWQPEVQFEGTLQPVREADLGFKVQGRLAQIRVRLGDRVSAGQTLATLEASESEAQVRAVEAQVRASEAQLALAADSAKRSEKLVGSGAASEQVGVQTGQQRSLAQAQLEAAKAQLALAQASLGNHVLKAPFSGYVTRVPSGTGAIVSPGVPLFHVQDTSVVKLSGAIGEADAALVKVGSPLELRAEGRTVQGKVSAILASVDAATRRVPLEAEIKNDGGTQLRTGVFVHAAVTGLAPVQVLKLPAAALRPGSQNEVMVIEGTRLHTRHILFARAADGSLLVRSGLEPKEKVMSAPTAEAQDGDSFVESGGK